MPPLPPRDHTEATPLLLGGTDAGARTGYVESLDSRRLSEPEQEAVAHESAFSAVQDLAHGVDPNASAFPPPADVSHVSLDAVAAPAPVAGHHAPPAKRADVLVILCAMWVGCFLAALDGTIVAVILAKVGSEFKVSKNVGWLGTSYLLTQTAFQPLYGRASDIFGRKAATLFASAVFLAGSVLCGVSQSFWQLCVARAIAGIGGGGLTSMTTIVTTDLVSLKSRGTWQGIGNLVCAAGAALGGPLGGALADGGLGWRAAFTLQVPLCVLHFVVVSWKVDIPAGPGSMLEKIKRIDGLGSLSLVSSISLLLVGLSLGGNERAWSDRVVVGSLVGGLALLAVFVLVERYVAREPVMPMDVVFRQTPGFVSVACWFASIAQFAAFYTVPSYFVAVEQTTSRYAGYLLIPNAVVTSVSSLASGLVIARTGRYKRMLVVGGALGVVGPLLLCTWHRGTSTLVYWISMPLGGASFGIVLTTTLVALISALEPAQVAAGTGITYLFRATGSVLGISLSGALLQNGLQRNLERASFPPSLIEAVRRDVGLIRTLKEPLRDAARQAYQESMHLVFVAVAVSGLLAFLSLFPIEENELPSKVPPAAAPPAPRPRD
ncbi:uncharacterized protein PFL1_00097 [Pseudozyma flocculosa PF-1]|nr:uncharacterized protein PFL1_00097 [Pseudozyma flocculosa PF-1]EPQ31898.1 hypothetical protein PFL1_00097 [Pseudozyma flocculosa PF-1]